MGNAQNKLELEELKSFLVGKEVDSEQLEELFKKHCNKGEMNEEKARAFFGQLLVVLRVPKHLVNSLKKSKFSTSNTKKEEITEKNRFGKPLWRKRINNLLSLQGAFPSVLQQIPKSRN